MPRPGREPACGPEGACDWGSITRQAGQRLVRELKRDGELSPGRWARIVARCAPRAAAARVLVALRRLGWHRSDARIAHDALEAGDCPLPHAPVQRAWLRLAVFGLPGQGFSTDHKNREAIFEQRCAEILRESRDLESLQMAAARALAHPAVLADSSLGSMLRAFIAQREAELRERLRAAQPSDKSKLQHAFECDDTDPEQVRQRVTKAVTRLRMRLESALAHYSLATARRTVCELKALLKAHPKIVKPGEVYHCESQVTRLEDRLTEFRRHLGELTDAGLEAARAGDLEKANWIDRRLAAISAMLPEVLPEGRQRELHEQIVKALDQFESQQAARRILDQERCVANEIKSLGGIVQRFRKLERTAAPGDPLLEEARGEYERAVREIQTRDEEWLADLMIRLDALLEDLRQRDESADAQVERFVARVRQALAQLRAAVQGP